MKYWCLSIFILGLNAKMLFCQTDSLEAEDWYNCYSEYSKYNSNKADSLALLSLDIAIPLYRKADLLGDWVWSHWKRANLLYDVEKQPFVVLNYLDSCLVVLDHWRKPSNRYEYMLLGYYYTKQADVAKAHAGDYLRAKIALEKTRKIFREELDSDDDGLAGYFLFQLGNDYVRMGEFKSARKVFEEGYEYSYKNDFPPAAKYPDYGGMYVTQGDYNKALAIFQEGLSRKGIPEDDEIFNKLSLAECYAKMRKFDDALRENKRVARQISRPLQTQVASGKLPEFKRYLYQNYGIIYADQEEWQEALKWYQLGLETELEYENSSDREAALFHIEIGNAYLKINQPDAALLSFHKALEAVLPNFRATPGSIPDPASFTAENVIYRALDGKAQCFEQLGQLDKALECYEKIPLVEAKLRATHDYESSTLEALKKSRNRLNKAIDIAWRLSGQGKKTAYTRRAFVLMEQARATIMMGQLSAATTARQLPDSLKEREYGLQKNIAWHEREMVMEHANGDSMDMERYKNLDDTLFQLKRKLKELQDRFPAYARTLAEMQYIPAAEVPALLSTQSALIEYYLSDSTLYIFCISGEGKYSWRREHWSKEQNDRTVQLAKIAKKPINDKATKSRFVELAAELYDILLKPELKTLPNVEALVIIPDEVLAFLPFEILLQKKAADTEHYTKLPYLIFDKSVSYAYSATFLRLQQQIQNTRRSGRKPFGAFIPRYSSNSTDPRSGEALNNLEDIRAAALLLQKLLDVPDSEQAQATEADFKKYAADYAILLLGMHGFADEENPELSRLMFGDPKSPSGEEEDNILYANELQLLRLQADQAILLACNTGNGEWRRGEGIYSLARAFALAGVPSTLMSLWNLPDEVAPPIMKAYFEALKSGKTKDKALQEAKKAYLSDMKHFNQAEPFYWAGMMSIGDIEPVYRGFPWCLVLSAALALLLLLLGWVIWRASKKGKYQTALPFL